MGEAVDRLIKLAGVTTVGGYRRLVNGKVQHVKGHTRALNGVRLVQGRAYQWKAVNGEWVTGVYEGFESGGFPAMRDPDTGKRIKNVPNEFSSDFDTLENHSKSTPKPKNWGKTPKDWFDRKPDGTKDPAWGKAHRDVNPKSKPDIDKLDLPETRSISDIAKEIEKEWGDKVNYAAKPYLDAMRSLNTLDDKYYQDDAESVVLYFLNNARGFTGERAKEIKKELKAMLAAKRKARGR